MASRFWVLGTGTWDASDTTHWSATTGGAGGASVPGSADTVTFDASSGGGTVTVNTTVTVQSITMGAFTGTLDFSANNNNVTVATSFNGSGSGTRTLNLGNGTWTINGTSGNVWNLQTTTGLTFNANSSTIALAAASGTLRTFQGGGLSYNTVSCSATSGTNVLSLQGANTIATLNITAPHSLVFQNGVTTTITNAFIWTGSSSSQIGIGSMTPGLTATISVASGSPTMSWAAVRDIICTGGATFTATNSFNLGNDSGITITAPSGGGGGPFTILMS